MPTGARTHKPSKGGRVHRVEVDRQEYRALPTNSTAWRHLRAQVLHEQPLCAHCKALGRVTAATEVDHLDNDPGNNHRNNLQGLCKPCHSRKTASEAGGLSLIHI